MQRKILKGYGSFFRWYSIDFEAARLFIEYFMGWADNPDFKVNSGFIIKCCIVHPRLRYICFSAKA